MITFPEMMFYMESEGLLPTRAGKINKTILDIKRYPADTISINDVNLLLADNGLVSFDRLSAREQRYIMASIK